MATYAEGFRNQNATAVGITFVDNENTDKQGMYVQLNNGANVYAVWCEKLQSYVAIRKLTPLECFRLQGWSDDYFEKATFINSDSQLYKQAGNGVTVSVIKAIGERMKVASNEPTNDNSR